MLEPQEIDALLISALYGELTPAEETRLEAHLGSHPADKTALAALTSTREAVRASRILQVQLDPPQSVSALLLQEAARRAPKPQEGWFARLARSFMAHPAMAAAAMLVVVIGVATLVQNRKGDHFADSTAPSQPQLNEAKPSAADGIIANQPAPTTTVDQTEALDQGAAGGGRASAGSGSAAVGADNDRYQVTLADGQAVEKSKVAVDAKKDESDRRKAADAPKQDPAPDTTRTGDETVAVNKKGKAPKASGAYMELRSPESQPTVKEFEGNANSEAAQVYATVPGDDSGKQVNAVTPGPGLGANGTGAATTAPPAPRGNAPVATKATPKVTTTAKVEPKPTENQVARNVDSAGARNPAPAPPPPVKVATPTTGAKAAEEKDKNVNDPQLAWAREQHTSIIARVKSGDCKGAATIAVGLANRDLAYYKQNVASDRSVRECLAYIDNAREKEQEQRAERSKAAQKRAMNEPAAAPAKKTEPVKPTDSK